MKCSTATLMHYQYLYYVGD